MTLKSTAPGMPSAPVDHLTPEAPPTLVVHGALDPMVPVADARAFVEALRAVSSSPVAYAEVPGMLHAFDRFDSLRHGGVAAGVLLFLDRLGLTRHFHCICDSFLEGVEKPDPAFFRIALDRAGAVPETTMHVGDLFYVDVAGARASGIQPMLIDPFGLYQGYDVDRVRTLRAEPRGRGWCVAGCGCRCLQLR